MKRFIIIAMLTAIMPLAAMAQHEEAHLCKPFLSG